MMSKIFEDPALEAIKLEQKKLAEKALKKKQREERSFIDLRGEFTPEEMQEIKARVERERKEFSDAIDEAEKNGEIFSAEPQKKLVLMSDVIKEKEYLIQKEKDRIYFNKKTKRDFVISFILSFIFIVWVIFSLQAVTLPPRA
ncbi:MAG: DUF1542 domain-containing protein [Chitinophagaceae bacterium]|nr:DUF1542 domain-containing protein [Chitinophagaceae bacterium]